MRLFASAAFLALALSAFADDVDQALMDLGADDGGRRDAAEKLLWSSDGSAYEQAKKALDASTDLEVQARLRPIVEWLAVQSKCAPLAQVWKDRWFVLRLDGKIVGVEHSQAALESAGGVKTWRFTTDTSLIDRRPVPDQMRLVVRARQDKLLSPISGEWEIREGESPVKVTFAWEKRGVQVEVKSGELALDTYEFMVGEARRHFDWEPRDDGDDSYALDVQWAELIERASLARIDELQVRLHAPFEPPFDHFHPAEAHFVAVETVEALGRKIEARRYDSGWGTFWVSDAEGLVRARIEGSELTRETEAVARAAGLDPESRATKKAADLLAALGGEDVAKASAAQAELLAMPDVADRVKGMLAASPSPRAKERLEAMTRWLDPEFGRAALEAAWKDRWVVLKSDGQVTGVEHQVLATKDGAWEFTSEADAIDLTNGLNRSRLVFRATPGSLAPISGEWEALGAHEAYRVRFSSADGQLKAEMLAPPGVEGNRRSKRVATRKKGPIFPAAVPDFFEVELVERASLARLEGLPLNALELPLLDNARADIVTFVDASKVDFGGRSLSARHYTVGTAEGNVRSEFWVTDEAGLVRGRIFGQDLERVDESTARAAGLDDTSRREIRMRAALADIGAKDPAKRDDAEAALSALPEALGPVRDAAQTAGDDDARARLERLARWLDPDFGRDVLAAMWKERYYSLVSEGKPVGGEKYTAVPGPDAGTLSWSGEGGYLTEPKPLHAAWSATTQFDPFLRPLRAEIDGTTEKGRRFRCCAAFDGLVPSVSKAVLLDEGRHGTGLEECFAPPTIDILVSSLVERAAMAGLKELEVAAWKLGDSAPGTREVSRVRFVGEETLDGKPVRRYARRTASGKTRDEYWVSPTEGMLRAEFEGNTLQACDRATWIATGLDSAENRAAEFRKRLEALKETDPDKWNDAYAALCGAPGDLPLLKAALAAETDPGRKTRLEALCHWHDPAFGQEALAKMPKERWFVAGKAGQRHGSAHVMMEPEPARGPGAWKIREEIVGLLQKAGADYEMTIHASSLPVPPSWDAEFHVQDGGHDIEVGFRLTGKTLSLGWVKEDGQEQEYTERDRDLKCQGDAVVPETVLPLLLERASLARLELIEINVWGLMDNDVAVAERFEYKGEDKLDVCGATVTARHYASGGREFWVSDADGMVKMTGKGMDMEPATEEEAKKANEK